MSIYLWSDLTDWYLALSDVNLRNKQKFDKIVHLSRKRNKRKFKQIQKFANSLSNSFPKLGTGKFSDSSENSNVEQVFLNETCASSHRN